MVTLAFVLPYSKSGVHLHVEDVRTADNFITSFLIS